MSRLIVKRICQCVLWKLFRILRLLVLCLAALGPGAPPPLQPPAANKKYRR